jgi:hypothetical protein
MVFRLTMFVLLVATQFFVPSTVQARTNLSRQEIRQMPITARPSRPGHFYGNTVRRSQSRAQSGPHS